MRRRDEARRHEKREARARTLQVFPRDLHFCAGSLERKSHRCVFVAEQRLVRRLSASNHISALNDAITLAAGNPKNS